MNSSFKREVDSQKTLNDFLYMSVLVPAKIASFDDAFTATFKEDVKLPCLAVGVPPPTITWKVRQLFLVIF